MLEGWGVNVRGRGLITLRGHGDLVSRLIVGIKGVILWLIGVIVLLAKSPCFK